MRNQYFISITYFSFLFLEMNPNWASHGSIEQKRESRQNEVKHWENFSCYGKLGKILLN